MCASRCCGRSATRSTYLFNVRDPDDMVRSAAESAMREVVGRRPAQDMFRDDRPASPTRCSSIAQAMLDSYGDGRHVINDDRNRGRRAADAKWPMRSTRCSVPSRTRTRFREEARQYANTLLGEARGQAAQIREDAAAYKNRVVQEARR